MSGIDIFQCWSAHSRIGKGLKEKLRRLECLESGASDESVESTDASSAESMSESHSPSPAPVSSLSARHPSELWLTYGPEVWQQHSGITSGVLLPVSRSSMRLPNPSFGSTGQGTCGALCTQCFLAGRSSSTESPSTLEHGNRSSLACEDSGPFDEGYAAMTRRSG